MSTQNKVVKFKKRRNINMGIIVFLILFLYIAINVSIYLTKDKLTIYEVHEGTTAVDNRITALILRQEKLVYSQKAGYVVYYLKDGSRVAKDSSVYSVTDSEMYNTDSSDTAITLSDKDDAEIKYDISIFRDSYTDDNYSSIYDFKENTQSTVLDILNSSMISEDKASGNENASSKGSVPSKESGVIAYYMDNYENVTPDSVTSDMFKTEKYQKTNLRTTEMIARNTPVYKIITSEEWNMVLSLTKAQYKKLKGKERVAFTILEDDYDMTAELKLNKKASDYYAILTMNRNLSNYLSYRYLDVKLDFDSVDGLKIPLTSIVDKDCYKIPVKYFTQGGDTQKKGLNKVTYNQDTGEEKYTFTPTEVYYQDDEFAYVDTQLFDSETTWIQSSKGSDRYQIKDTVKLKGVYNVNLGYSVFKRIEILYQSDDYCIISKDTLNGLSAYDHIALDGKTAVDQQIIY